MPFPQGWSKSCCVQTNQVGESKFGESKFGESKFGESKLGFDTMLDHKFLVHTLDVTRDEIQSSTNSL